jgi:hypothetical protein
VDKAVLLGKIEDGYLAFEALLKGLNEIQMTAPGVNGMWSIKDNLAHLGAWHRRLLDLLEGVRRGEEPASRFAPGVSEDDINEQFYWESKDRPLTEVLATFRTSYQRVLAVVQAMTAEDLNKPILWLKERPIWLWVAGNTYEHYEEHSAIIRTWLASQ